MANVQLQAKAHLALRKRKEQKLREFENLRDYYKANPLMWMEERLGIRQNNIKWSMLPVYDNHKWDGDKDPLWQIIESLKDGVRRIGVESATGTGKTFIAACIVLWFLDCFENSLVVTTAPKQDQLTLHIWKEIGKLHPRFGKGDLTTLKLRMIENKEEWSAVGFVAGVKADEDSSTKAQGFHAKDMLIILEETPGVPKPIITALENTSVAPHNIILALGNPDNMQDTLHAFCTQEGTKHIRISALDHPNVVTGNADFIPGATSLYGIKGIRNKYGSESSMYKSRVRGITPKQSSDSLIMMDWITKCVEMGNDVEKVKEHMRGEPALGVDVANSENGDKAAIALGKGSILIEVEDFQCPDANQLGKRDVIAKMNENDIKQEYVGIDGVGVGAGTVNALKEMNIEVQNLLGGASPIDQENEQQKYNNLRTQMWWQLREDIRKGNVILPNDTELHSDLTAPKWSIKEKYIVLESKKDIKARLGRSPNKGDAVVYWNWVRTLRAEKMIDFLT